MIEIVTGKPLNQVVSERVLAPSALPIPVTVLPTKAGRA
ncbi:MAG: hypothetical protein R3D34_15445 [Nitratireductor sp.]